MRRFIPAPHADDEAQVLGEAQVQQNCRRSLPGAAGLAYYIARILP